MNKFISKKNLSYIYLNFTRYMFYLRMFSVHLREDHNVCVVNTIYHKKYSMIIDHIEFKKKLENPKTLLSKYSF